MIGTRRRVILIAIAILVILDIGRSVFARLGHARPTELWQPSAEVYADLAWPPGSDVPASAPPGRRLYVRWCATCHGPDGRGNGPAAPELVGLAGRACEHHGRRELLAVNDRRDPNGDGGRFGRVLRSVVGRRIDYKTLAGKLATA